jgi:hypothetical protein
MSVASGLVPDEWSEDVTPKGYLGRQVDVGVTGRVRRDTLVDF